MTIVWWPLLAIQIQCPMMGSLGSHPGAGGGDLLVDHQADDSHLGRRTNFKLIGTLWKLCLGVKVILSEVVVTIVPRMAHMKQISSQPMKWRQSSMYYESSSQDSIQAKEGSVTVGGVGKGVGAWCLLRELRNRQVAHVNGCDLSHFYTLYFVWMDRSLWNDFLWVKLFVSKT